MAGTPTPNYQFPTYAETDTPNLAGAYNQAVNAIDAKIKEVADTIPSGSDVPDATSTTKGIAKLYDSASIGDSTQEDGGVTPAAMKAAVDGIAASVSGKQDKLVAIAPIDITGIHIGVAGSVPEEDGTVANSGVVTVTGKQEDIASATSPSTSPVPNAKAVKDYVDAKVPTEQQAYTGTAPVVVNNGDKTISVNETGAVGYSEDGGFSVGAPGVVPFGRLSDPSVYNAFATDPDAKNISQALGSVPSVNVMRTAITLAVNSTPQAWNELQAAATTPLTTEMLANLYVTPSGMVVYKAPTE